MAIKKRYLVLILVIGAILGWLVLGGSAAVLHATSTTEFCVSCHTMDIPFEEYQGSVHYTNATGIRAECADCHIPEDTVGYLLTKIRATKDVYHQFVTRKIDTEEQYEAHRLEMAETVWDRMRKNDSKTCRSCHDYDSMELYDQSEDALSLHTYAVENNQTCIECHKGVAHFTPQLELDSSAFLALLEKTEETPAETEFVYPVTSVDMGDLGTINPTAKLSLLDTNGTQRNVQLDAYQMKGAEQVMYIAEGKRAIVANLTEKGMNAVEAGPYEADIYGNEWRSASLVATIDGPVLASPDAIWSFAEELDNVYCATCHAKIPANHFTVNAWGPVAKSMGERTDISAENLELLTKFFQNHAKDVSGH